jgi:hypothetical protein
MLHAIYQGCQALHGGDSTLNNGSFNVLVADVSFMKRDQYLSPKNGSERREHVCRTERGSLQPRNAVQHATKAQQVTLTAKVHTYFERFLNNLTAHATEDQQQMLEGVFQRFAGGNVAYYGRRGVCGWGSQDTPYTLAEKLDIMLQEVEKRRNLYIATLLSDNLRSSSRCNAEQLPERFPIANLSAEELPIFTSSSYHLNQMMLAWEHDYESWMHEEHWKGFHK